MNSVKAMVHPIVTAEESLAMCHMEHAKCIAAEEQLQATKEQLLASKAKHELPVARFDKLF